MGATCLLAQETFEASSSGLVPDVTKQQQWLSAPDNEIMFTCSQVVCFDLLPFILLFIALSGVSNAFQGLSSLYYFFFFLPANSPAVGLWGQVLLNPCIPSRHFPASRSLILLLGCNTRPSVSWGRTLCLLDLPPLLDYKRKELSVNTAR